MTNSEIKAVLVRALARLKDGAAWTKHRFARDHLGREVAPDHTSAVCWCALGAVYAELEAPYDDFKEVTAPLRRRWAPARLNDDASTFAPIRELYERAIASLDA